jgi:catechol 2,3-dioxygenase-like lactoylglutathione lyase family enzyme
MIEIERTTVTIWARDLDASQEFYTTKLGFEVAIDAGPYFRLLQRPDLALGLHPWDASEGDAGADRSPAIGFIVLDLAAARATLEASGVVFPAGSTRDGGGVTTAAFADPDGTALYLMEQR